MIELRNITKENFSDCLALEGGPYADEVVFSLAEAWMEGAAMKPIAIYNTNRLIGYSSIYVTPKNCQIVNFLIDKKFQNQGLGSKSVEKCFEYLKDEFKARVVILPIHKENDAGRRFWTRIGFEITDNVQGSYTWYEKIL